MCSSWRAGTTTSDSGAADHYARLKRERSEARITTYQGHGSVRSFRAGTTFTLTQSLLDLIAGDSAADKDAAGSCSKRSRRNGFRKLIRA